MTVAPKVPLWLAVVGTSCIFGGEALCLLGPLRYERIVHFTCHVILYGGVVSVAIAAALRLADRQKH